MSPVFFSRARSSSMTVRPVRAIICGAPILPTKLGTTPEPLMTVPFARMLYCPGGVVNISSPAFFNPT